MSRFFRFILCFSFPLWLLAFGVSSVHAQEDDPSPPEEPVRLIFIHHSTGENWLKDGYGDLGIALGENNYFVSDTNYGWGPDSIGDRTDIVNWPEWFGPERSERALDRLYAEDGQNTSYTRTLDNPGGENEIILFKSCFPNSELGGSPDDPPTSGDYDRTVGSSKYIYNLLLDYFASRPDKMFVVITAPPVISDEWSANARAFNDWLVYDWLADYPGSNVFVFDFYNVLTGPDNHHRFLGGQIEHVATPGMNTEYYPSGDDHPNEAGSLKATEEFVPLLNVYYHRWRVSAPYQPPAGDQPPAEEQLQEEVVSGQPEDTTLPVSGSLLEDFETGLEGWGSYDDGAGSSLTCVADSSTAYSGNNALRIEYSLVANGWVGCERYYETPQDWSTSDGIRFNLYSQQGGLGGSLIITVGEGDQTAPFEAFYEAGDSENWQQVYFSWQDFQRPDWAEESGPQTFDPASIVGFDFAFSAGEEAIQNVIWVDDLGLGETEAQPETSEQLETEEEVAEEEETAQGEGGIRGLIGRLFPNCPLSLALPLVVLPLALRRKVRRRGMERR